MSRPVFSDGVFAEGLGFGKLDDELELASCQHRVKAAHTHWGRNPPLKIAHTRADKGRGFGGAQVWF